MSDTQRHTSIVRRLLAVGVVLLLLITACSSSSDSGTSEDASHLTVAVTGYRASEGFDPIQNSPISANLMHGLVYDWLIHIDPETGQPVPGVINEFVESPDGTYWDFRLRDDLTFHDGTKATSRDLEFTLNQYMREDALRADLREAASRVEVLDDLAVRVHVKSPQPYFPYMFTNNLPNHGNLVSRDYFEKVGWDEAISKPIGVGPWKFVSGVKGDSYEYVRNEDYWGTKPSMEKLTTIQVPELATQIAMLESGEVDMITVPIDDIDRVKEKYATVSGFAPQIRYDIFGAYDPRAKGMPTADIRVREAMARAIDYPAVRESLLHGIALDRMPPRVLRGMPEVDFSWSDYIEKLWTYDPERSKQLLAEAGYPNGFDIQMFVRTEAIELEPDIAEVVQAYWKEIGINGTIEPVDGDQYFDLQGPSDRAVGQVVFGGTTVYGLPAANMSWVWGLGGHSIHSDRRDPVNPQVFLPELNNLVSAAEVEKDPVKRKGEIDQFIKIGLDTYTSYTFGQVPTVMAISNNWQLVGVPDNLVVTADVPLYFIPWLTPAQEHGQG
jgi:peptide/nickel transport system substrate-binding protein